MHIAIRKAKIEDAVRLLEIKNDPDVMRYSIFSKKPIKFEHHIKWLEDRIDNEKVQLYVIFNEGSLVGDIRFDIEEEIEVSVRIDPRFRNQGIGTTILNDLGKYIRGLHFKPMVCRIIKYNLASLKLFLKCGFVLQRIEGDICYLKWELPQS
jgi:RimJ/RimL family protein N-acetyltransferase